MAVKNSSLNAVESILESYLALTYEKGGPGFVTLQMVAKRSKLAFGTIRYHFSSEGKPSLEEGAIDYVFRKSYEHHEKVISNSRIGQKQDFNPLHAYVDSMFDWLNTKPVYAHFIVFYFYLWTTEYGKNRFAKQKQKYYQTVYSRLDCFLYESIGRGLYPKVKDKANLVLVIYNLVLAGCLHQGMNLSGKSLNQQKELCKNAVDCVCNGF